MARRYILSIDGGGIRGIIPASALVQLEKMTGRLTRDMFDFVAGTSTGAVIAAAVAAGVPATRILDFYVRHSRELFTRSPLKVLRRVLFGSMYDTWRLRALIAEVLGEASTWTLDDSPVGLLVTAKRLSDGMPWYFVRNDPANTQRTGHLPLVDCVTASAAAPTFFAPWTIPEPVVLPDHEPIGLLVDGGVGVTGNPVYQACVEAFYYTGGYDPSQTTVVSLGTGQFALNVQPGWIGDWLAWILRELLRSPGEQQTDIVERHFAQADLYRIDPDLRQLDPTLDRDIPLDDLGSIERLQQYGARFAARIDWPSILASSDTRFRVNPHNTLPRQYQQF